MSTFIITVAALSLVAILALVSFAIKSKEYNDLLDKYSDDGKLICKLKNELNTLTTENVRLTNENRDYFVEKMKQNFYREFHRFVVVSEDLTNYMENNVKRLEEEDYHYDKDRSFPTVLCFTKRVPTIKDEPKDDTDQTEETLNQTF